MNDPVARRLGILRGIFILKAVASQGELNPLVGLQFKEGRDVA